MENIGCQSVQNQPRSLTSITPRMMKINDSLTELEMSNEFDKVNMRERQRHLATFAK